MGCLHVPFKIFLGGRERRSVQYPIHLGATLTLPPPHIVQEHKGDESAPEVPAQQDATVSKDGELHLTQQGFIVLVCLCDERRWRPFGSECHRGTVGTPSHATSVGARLYTYIKAPDVFLACLTL